MMFAFFVGAILWIWRPGSRAAQDDAGQIPFRHDDGPGSLGEQQK
jgi:cytochrome c oxidase cbb3-type subunit 4